MKGPTYLSHYNYFPRNSNRLQYTESAFSFHSQRYIYSSVAANQVLGIVSLRGKHWVWERVNLYEIYLRTFCVAAVLKKLLRLWVSIRIRKMPTKDFFS